MASSLTLLINTYRVDFKIAIIIGLRGVKVVLLDFETFKFISQLMFRNFQFPIIVTQIDKYE